MPRTRRWADIVLPRVIRTGYHDIWLFGAEIAGTKALAVGLFGSSESEYYVKNTVLYYGSVTHLTVQYSAGCWAAGWMLTTTCTSRTFRPRKAVFPFESKLWGGVPLFVICPIYYLNISISYIFISKISIYLIYLTFIFLIHFLK